MIFDLNIWASLDLDTEPLILAQSPLHDHTCHLCHPTSANRFGAQHPKLPSPTFPSRFHWQSRYVAAPSNVICIDRIDKTLFKQSLLPEGLHLEICTTPKRDPTQLYDTFRFPTKALHAYRMFHRVFGDCRLFVARLYACCFIFLFPSNGSHCLTQLGPLIGGFGKFDQLGKRCLSANRIRLVSQPSKQTVGDG